jgi:hypothetical protein
MRKKIVDARSRSNSFPESKRFFIVRLTPYQAQ